MEKSLSSTGKCSSKWKNLFRVRENVLRNGKISFECGKMFFEYGKISFEYGKISFELRKNILQIWENFCFIVDIAVNTRESLLLAMEMPKSVGDYSKKEFIKEELQTKI